MSEEIGAQGVHNFFIPWHSEYSAGQHKLCDIRVAHDGKVGCNQYVPSSIPWLCWILIGCFVHGMVQISINASDRNGKVLVKTIIFKNLLQG